MNGKHVRPSIIGLAIGLLISAGCVNLPIQPELSTGTVWGYLELRPSKGVEPGKKDGGSYGDRRLRDVEFVDYENVEFGVVYTEGDLPSSDGTTLTIQASRFGPRLASNFGAVGLNGKVVVRNSDGVRHLISCPQTGFLKSVEPADQVEVFPDGEGELSIFVVDISGMKATVFVCSGPYSVASEHGRWELSNLSPGKHILRAWHPRFPVVSREVEVQENVIHKIDMAISINIADTDSIIGNH